VQGYFEYGRSIEGKFERMVINGNLKSISILGYGWLKDERYESLPKLPDKNQILVAVYGMSHVKELGEAINKINNRYIIRDITAPGAPFNWSLAAYEVDKDNHKADVVIIGIMTENVQYLSSTSGATSYFDMGHPYTFPRYFIENGKLKKLMPPFYTSDGFKEYLFNREKWEEYRNWLSKYDKYFNSFLFKKSFIDKFVTFRVVRRAFAQKIRENKTKYIFTNSEGFNPNCEEILVLNEMIKLFAQIARKQKSIPIIYIVNNEGKGDYLYRALKPVLEANNIPFLSTHLICPPDDPKVFTGVNSHFIQSKNIELAKEVIKLIEIEKEKASNRNK